MGFFRPWFCCKVGKVICVLDVLTCCLIPWLCNRHDNQITRPSGWDRL